MTPEKPVVVDEAAAARKQYLEKLRDADSAYRKKKGAVRPVDTDKIPVGKHKRTPSSKPKTWVL